MFNTALFAQVDTLMLQDFEQKARRSYRENIDSSLFYCQQIITSCQPKDFPKYHAFALNWTGICYMKKGQMDSAELFYQKAVDYGLKNDQNKIVQMARLNRSINYFQQGEYERAALAAEKSLESFREIGDSLGMGHAQYNLGNCLYRLDRIDEALSFYRAAESIYSVKGSALNKANLYNAIGGIFYFRQDFNKAIAEYQRSVDIKISVGGENYCASEYNNIGNSFRELAMNDSALHYYKKSMVTAKALGDNMKVSMAMMSLATILSKKQDPDSAVHYGVEASQLAKEIGDPFLIYNSYLELSTVYASIGNYEQAFEYHKAYVQLKDTVQDTDVIQRVSELEKKYQLSEKERQIAVQNLEIKNKDIAIQRQVAIIFLLIGGVITVVLWNRNRKIQQQIEHEQAMNDERSRIAMDLHDQLGAELTMISSKIDLQAYQVERSSMQEELSGISDQVRKAGKTLRETVWSIQNDAISLDQLLGKLDDFAGEMLSPKEISFEVDAEVTDVILTPQVALDTFRIFQEGITNASKYSAADKVGLMVNLSGNSLKYTLEDNGQGFDQSEQSAGFGLQNMNTRAANIKGILTIKSSLGKGTTVNLTVPV